MKWFKKASPNPSKADWIYKNVLRVSLGDDVSPGDTIDVTIVACDGKLDIYPGTATIDAKYDYIRVEK
jgi:hypothetical protein